MMMIRTLAYEFQISIPLLVTTTFRKEVGSYTILTYSLVLEEVIGGFVPARYANVSQKLPKNGATFIGLMMFGMAVAPNYFFELVVTTATGAVSILLLSTAKTLLQMTAKEEIRGCVMAL